MTNELMYAHIKIKIAWLWTFTATGEFSEKEGNKKNVSE